MTGNIGRNIRVLVFKNENKIGDDDPDFYLCISNWGRQKPEKEKGGQNEEQIPF